TSLLAFNVGVEIGQIVVLAALIPLLELLFRYLVAERMGMIILSALVAHTGWHWMTERAARLREYRFEWPVLDIFFLLALTRWLLAIVAVAGIAWLVKLVADRPSRRPEAHRGDTSTFTIAVVQQQTNPPPPS